MATIGESTRELANSDTADSTDGMGSLPELLLGAAAECPDRPFLSWHPHTTELSMRKASVGSGADAGGLSAPDVPMSYAEGAALVRGLARGLADTGVRPGDRVAVVLPNCPELALLWFAAGQLGAALVPLDPRLTDQELQSLLAHAEPAVVACPGDRARHLGLAQSRVVATDARRGTTGTQLPTLSELLVASDAAGPAPPDPATPAAVLYTSGSTGRPKGCVLTHHSFTLPTAAVCRRLRLTGDDVLFHVLPLHHMAGVSFLATGVACRGRVALHPRFSGSRFWQEAVASGATVWRHLGEMVSVLCAQSRSPEEGGHRLRLAYGAGVPGAVAERFRVRFGVPMVEGYGLSETNTVACGDVSDARPGTLGDPLPHVRLRLVDGNGNTVVGPGTGELLVRRNPAMLQGYLGEDGLTAAAFSEGWFRTGDLVHRDLDGRLRFVSRAKELIRRRGENIDPVEVEQVSERCPGVHRAAAIGVPDAVGGTEILLFVQPEPDAGITAEQVRQHQAGRLAGFKQPRDIEFVDQLPLTATEKIDKSELRQWAAAGAVSVLASSGRPA